MFVCGALRLVNWLVTKHLIRKDVVTETWIQPILNWIRRVKRTATLKDTCKLMPQAQLQKS